MKKFPTLSQWKQLFKILKGAERTFFLILSGLAVISAGYLVISFYINNTKVVPAYSGTYSEGLVGQPRFINPIYGETNDVDRALIDLTYSGLMTYDKDGNIVNDLVKSFQVSDDGRTYVFQLKDKLYWQDGIPLTADDVIYTIKTIQNSDYKSPLRASWLNVDSQKISDNSFALSLGTPYSSFLENLTVKIIPQHIWKNVLPENFPLSSYNLQPIGSGPYTVSNLEQNGTGFIKNITLTANHKYYQKPSYISNIIFKFFENKDDLIKAANQKTIDGFSVASLNGDESLAESQIRQGWTANEKFGVYSFSMPRYFAVFFNTQKSKLLSDGNITKGLSYAVNKQELVQKIAGSSKEKISIVNSPILPDYYGFAQPSSPYNFDLDQANKLLDKSGYKMTDSGQRTKQNDKKLAFQFNSYLSAKSKGTQVAELQKCLSKLDDNFKNLLVGETNGTYGKGTENAVTEFQKKYLPDSKPTGEVGTGTRQKLNELCFASTNNSLPLKFTLTTVDQPQMVKTANLLKDYWQKVGVTIDINAVGLSDFKDIIKNREYDALLYGEAFGNLPDFYPFWDSTQVNNPGLNLSEYQNKQADTLLRDAKQATDPEVKAQKYEALQNIILSDAPALFLYNNDYLYWASGKIKGINTTKIVDPAKRFANITNWYISTKRAWK
jgi:peptide/nickel transport system substrate-binding protein